MKVSQLKANPANPRIIRDDRFTQLVKSLTEFPEMMAKRPMVCVTDADGKLFPLGGNMRLRAIQHLGMKDIPDEWVSIADDWTEDKRREFTIKDNSNYGSWDFDALANEWDAVQLEDWGVEIPIFDTDGADDAADKDLSGELKETFEVIISCKDETHQEQVYNKMIADGFDVRVLTL